MKKLLVILGIGLLLTGCSSQQTMETVFDVYEPVSAQPRQLEMALPEDAALATVADENSGKLYFCDDFCILVQTMQAGDLDSTLRQVTGFSKEQLTVIETAAQDAVRYDCAWSSVGEGGDQTCRGVILDDGYYHYAVTVMADAQDAGDLTQAWQELFNSVSLTRTD